MYHLLGRFGTVRRKRAEEGLGIISLAGRLRVSGKVSRVGGRECIGIITRDHFVWGFGNVGRSSAKE
jgi:hypothetical protein